MTAFKPGDRVRVAEDAMCSDGSDDYPSSAAGLTRFINGGPDRHGDYRLDGGAWAHGSFLTLITPDPDPQEAPMPEYIDPSTLPEGWTLCEVTNPNGVDRMFREVSRAGIFRNTKDSGGWMLGSLRIVRVIEPDLPVIAYEDIGPGMVVEKRERFAIRADGLWGGYLPEFRLVSAPEPDPDAGAVNAIRNASYSIHNGGERVDPLPGLPEAGDMLKALRSTGWDLVKVDEHRAGTDEQ